MRIGLIARADNRGLGQQTWSFYRNMQPVKTMVVDCPSAQPLPMRLDRFPDATVISGLPTHADMQSWLPGLDVVYTAETGYGQALWDVAEQVGVRTVLAANYEFLDRTDRPTVWAAPSLWHINDWPAGTIHLPVPIETDRFTVRSLPDTAHHYLHIVGRPTYGPHGDLNRNGTIDLLASLQYIDQPITVTIKCQTVGYTQTLLNQFGIAVPPHVNLRIDEGDVENYWDNYTEADILVLPRRFGGLSLPVNEALGAGIPVIMPDIDPNNTWLPPEWLVTAHPHSSFRAKQHIDTFVADHVALARKIDDFASQPDYYQAAKTKANELREALSWNTLRPVYEEALSQ